MTARIFVLSFVALFVVGPAVAANDQAGAACLQKCRTNLKKTGQWNSYPYGHCRNQCGYWVGAEKDKR